MPSNLSEKIIQWEKKKMKRSREATWEWKIKKECDSHRPKEREIDIPKGRGSEAQPPSLNRDGVAMLVVACGIVQQQWPFLVGFKKPKT